MLKRNLSVLTLCALLSSPVTASALDGADSWRNLTPREKENIQRNYQRWQNLPPKDKEHLREEWYRWRNLPQDKRDRLRRRYDDLQKRPRDDPRIPRAPQSGGKSRWSDEQRSE